MLPTRGPISLPGLVLLTIVVAFLVWGMLRPHSDFRIKVTPKGVQFAGKFPPGYQSEVAEFLRREAALTRGTIYGTWTAPHILRITFRGPIPAPRQQQVRNFLKLTLRG